VESQPNDDLDTDAQPHCDGHGYPFPNRLAHIDTHADGHTCA
jgi:hypothetical protein